MKTLKETLIKEANNIISVLVVSTNASKNNKAPYELFQIENINELTEPETWEGIASDYNIKDIVKHFSTIKHKLPYVCVYGEDAEDGMIITVFDDTVHTF